MVLGLSYGSPTCLLDHFTVWFGQFLFLRDRFSYHNTKEKDKTDSIKTQENRVDKVLSVWNKDSFRQNKHWFLFLYSASHFASKVSQDDAFIQNKNIKPCFSAYFYLSNSMVKLKNCV